MLESSVCVINTVVPLAIGWSDGLLRLKTILPVLISWPFSDIASTSMVPGIIENPLSAAWISLITPAICCNFPPTTLSKGNNLLAEKFRGLHKS